MNDFKARQWILPDGSKYPPHRSWKKWHYWGVIDGKFVDPHKSIISGEGNYGKSFQSTGFHDSKGVEIFEGSIMRHDLTPTNIAVIEWDQNYGMWRLDENSDYASSSLADYLIGNYATVIGNTTENPELLIEVGK